MEKAQKLDGKSCICPMQLTCFCTKRILCKNPNSAQLLKRPGFGIMTRRERFPTFSLPLHKLTSYVAFIPEEVVADLGTLYIYTIHVY